MKSTGKPEPETVRGIVVPTDWDATGEPRRVAILTPEEGEYRVAPHRAGPQLLSHLREEVEARVAVTSGPDGRETVTVLSFTVVEDSMQNGSDDDGKFTEPHEPSPRGSSVLSGG